MKNWLDDQLARWVSRWVDFVRLHARSVLTLNAGLTLAFAVLLVPRLGINMDHKRLLDPDLPFQRAAADFAKHFPPLDDSLLVVLDGEEPEQVRQAAQKLANALRARRDTVRDVYIPGGGQFFERHALLYRTPEELDDFVDHLARLQPVLAELSREPTIANLAHLIRLGLEQERKEGQSGEDWAAVLNRISDATVRVFADYPVSISWESLMLQGSALEQASQQILIVEPVLDFDRLLVAARPLADIRDTARALGITPERGIRLRITGNPALNHEEMIGLAWDVGWSSLVSFALVMLILLAAFRSLRLVVAAGVTLIVGLIWTTAFAALAVGQLNLVSIAFGVLFIGLGIDFAIHLGMQYSHAIQTGASPAPALRLAAHRCGSSLVLCAVTTTVGFYAFVPTPYRGVAELGLIAGSGMFIILFQTFTCFPPLAFLLLRRQPQRRSKAKMHLHLAPPALVARHPRVVILFFLAFGLASAVLLPRLRFDVNVVQMRNPDTESVQAFNDLLENSRTSPWSIDVLTTSLADAGSLSLRLRDLNVVESAISLSDYVPPDQGEKLDTLNDAALMLDVPSPTRPQQRTVPVEEQVEALQDLHHELSAAWLRSSEAPLAPAAQRLREELGGFLRRVEAASDPRPALAELERLLLGNFDQQFERLKLALAPSTITLDSLPGDLKSRMLARDGSARVQVFPNDHLGDTPSLETFVDAVREIEPTATGVAVNLVEFGRATVASLRQALLGALLGIGITVWLLFRRLGDTALVLVPVGLAAVLTGAAMVALGIPFNFANVVVLPLLLGVGVDSGIHLVHRAISDPERLLETITAQAVFYSALTTIASFASLAFSDHRGIASLGRLLVCGMIMTLLCNLVLLPGLIAFRATLRKGGLSRHAMRGLDTGPSQSPR